MNPRNDMKFPGAGFVGIMGILKMNALMPLQILVLFTPSINNDVSWNRFWWVF